MRSRILVYMLIAGSILGCRTAQAETSVDITVIADGRETTHSIAADLTVDQALAQARIELGARDRISHPLVSPAVDGMRITVRRVSEAEICEREEIAYQRRLLPKEGVPPGEREAGRSGYRGLREACYRILLEDEKEVDRVQLGAATVVREPIDEIIYVGISKAVTPLAIPGRLSYINHENAWTITGTAAGKRRLTQDHRLDALVFHQSDDGERLLFTSDTNEADDFFNELWFIATAGDSQPVRMTPTDVLFAQWRPRAGAELAYSTGERSPGASGWKALNNLWLMSVDLESGRALDIEEALPESAGGLYGWRGRNFSWSPNGGRLAWAKADGFGLVDLDGKRLEALSQYAVFHSAADWVWLSPLSWSHDGQLLAAVAHGAPIGEEPAEASPVFDLVVSSADGRFTAALRLSAGMWAAPAFSPNLAPRAAEYSAGHLAWLQAREPHNSMSGEYDLMLADRDGSNQRRLFPAPGERGIRKNDFASMARDFVWSPDGRFIALIYEGDLWLIDLDAAASHQVTFDGQSSNPVWTR